MCVVQLVTDAQEAAIGLLCRDTPGRGTDLAWSSSLWGTCTSRSMNSGSSGGLKKEFMARSCCRSVTIVCMQGMRLNKTT